MGTLERLPGITGRKVGMTSNHHAPYDLGYTRATMAVTERSESARKSKPQKGSLSSDCSLQLDYMKLESLVKERYFTILSVSGLWLGRWPALSRKRSTIQIRSEEHTSELQSR